MSRFQKLATGAVITLGLLVQNSTILAAGVSPDVARVRAVNMMWTNGFYSPATLLGSDGTKISHLRTGKGKGFLKKTPGPITYTLTSDFVGEQILGTNAFPTNLSSGIDYLFVYSRTNTGNNDPECIQYNVVRSSFGPPEGKAGLVIINTMKGNDLTLRVNGSVTDGNFAHGEVYHNNLDAGVITIQAEENPTEAVQVDLSLKAEEGMIYYVIIGGTTDTADDFPPITNIYKTKY